ncbi:tyrosine-type recombinase/integrase [Pseudorhodoplanes sp.]|uniref:tyrosine-type recombinase/integrase n=1 Tax=Pseudorhodoplanes sp. TaxID=1934341 RepID=UPI003D0F5476
MSVRKRRWKTKEGEKRGGWLADYRDQAGKRHQKLFARKKDADAFIAQAKVDVRAGIHTPESQSPTVAQAAALWLSDRAANGLERATLAQYRQHVELHIKPFIGRVKLSKLSTPMIVDFREALRSEEPIPGQLYGRARSPALIRKILTSLGSLIAYAKESGKIAGANPVRELARSKRAGGESRRNKPEIGRDIPSREEIKCLLEAIPSEQEPFLLVAIFCGLRASELRGLRWSDVDLKFGEIHVRQRADRYCKIGPPKSKSGNRKIPVPPGVLKRLKEWKLVCPMSDASLVFPAASGLVQHHSNIVRQILNPALKTAGIVKGDGAPKYGLHSLRHFFASWLINRKRDGGREMPLKAVQVLMGHSSITITADRYGHLFPRGDDAAELADAERKILG